MNQRLTWIEALKRTELAGVEFGAGAGMTKILFPECSIVLTDILDSDWLDLGEVDALNTPFEENSFDYILVNNVLHHLASPRRFLFESQRILREGGHLIIQEIHTSFLMRAILKFTNHESFDSATRALTSDSKLSREDDPWDANCDIARQLFDSKREFESKFPSLKIVHDRKTEFLTFLNSGGVVVSAPFVPMGVRALQVLATVDKFLCGMFPNTFALQRQLILEKKAGDNASPF
jgi:SAM-dependent methyltransferase